MNKMQNLLTAFIITSILLCNMVHAMKRQRDDVLSDLRIAVAEEQLRQVEQDRENRILLIQEMQKWQSPIEPTPVIVTYNFVPFQGFIKEPKVVETKTLRKKIECEKEKCTFVTSSMNRMQTHKKNHEIIGIVHYCNECDHSNQDHRDIKSHVRCHIDTRKRGERDRKSSRELLNHIDFSSMYRTVWQDKKD